MTVEFIAIGLLPALAADLDISLSSVGWLVSGFALAAARRWGVVITHTQIALLGPATALLAALLIRSRKPRRTGQAQAGSDTSRCALPE